MENLFLDTNVIIDYLDERPGYTQSARKLMLLGILGEFNLWIGASQVTDVFYILSNGGRASEAERVKAKIREIRKFIHICSLAEPDIDAALESPWVDFEDACLYECARKVKAKAIITRNKKDFEKSFIRVCDCDEWFAYLEETKGLIYEEIQLE